MRLESSSARPSDEPFLALVNEVRRRAADVPTDRLVYARLLEVSEADDHLHRGERGALQEDRRELPGPDFGGAIGDRSRGERPKTGEERVLFDHLKHRLEEEPNVGIRLCEVVVDELHDVPAIAGGHLVV